ncbi:DUF2796 domain-containing protein [Rhizobium terrae]|uniref:DUF2796 domain-containing protein n=1 Tax=Rhizobium terrae TaxID=2171756 RepID=UPI000E3BED74|nr:DUF2796 domain-containing protein [Rhizobium terrae]
MRLHHHVRTLFAAGMLIVVSAVHAEEERRELGPHVHGHGTLVIVVEDNNLQMELSAPGMDIVGFEYEPETARERKAVEDALADLKEPLKLITLPESAGCTVTSADASIAVKDHEDHDEAAGAEKTAETDEKEGRHTEFRASYALACADTASITSIYFPFFNRFSGSEMLAVTTITDNGQSSYEVTREVRRLEEM